MIRSIAVSLALMTSTAAIAQSVEAPINSPPAAALKGGKALPGKWDAKAREIYKTAVETPTVKGRAGENLKLANYIAGELRGPDGRIATSTSCPTRRCRGTTRRRSLLDGRQRGLRSTSRC
ncbi:hypothetical protein H9L14_10170 [Sphingomonas sediminicola]|uniref:Uncharacterized protein n=1 Tax=Sphingomonas sediminicola TaxID=386874 RepID=A0ABX6T5J7_9SPHN|nr:hypothetical protein [Sphingomonas sediminicola]QNP45055.1 hypothetical protein H9L14_10170 [Sphingomonas sediminicola]